MKKLVIYFLALMLITSVITGCSKNQREIVVVPIPVEDRLAIIDGLLDEQDYAGVRTIYEEAIGEDKQIIKDHLEGYAMLYIDEAKETLSTKRLEQFRETGYSGIVLTDGISLIERLIASELLYKEGKIAYNGRDFETAKEKLGEVDPDYSGYDSAQKCLAEITNREKAWQTAKYGRDQGTYALAYDSEFVYVPYELDGVFGILKADANSTYTEFIPLSDKGSNVIAGINVIGDYLYFIAGEDVGRGLMFEDPYCIYEMKTDGSGLAQVAQGDYFDLTIHDSQVYALSYTKGLVQMDKDFKNETVIASGHVIEASVTTEGIYYTVQGSLGSSSDNTVYFYDGQESVKVDSGSFMHYYTCSQNVLTLESTGSKNEALYLDGEKIAATDILKVYGLVGGRVIYSTPGNDAQERLKDYDITSSDTQSYTGKGELPLYYIAGISYETERIFLVNRDGVYAAKAGFDEIQTFELPSVDTDKLTANMALLRHIGDAELYSPEEPEVVVVSDELLWYYSDASINIVMEKRFLEETECIAYITHIRTNDFSRISTGSWGDSADSKSTADPEDVAAKYGVIYGQSTDFFNYNNDTRRGIVIRNGEVFRDHIYNSMLAIYPDGRFETYEKADTISADRLIEDGVMNTFSFGPVLVEDGFLSSSSTNSKVAVRNPRSAIGMVEPGHYVSIVVDGRSSKSRGLTTVALGELFADEGCKVAYNLDGGGTISAVFLGNMMKLSTHYRNIPDILYFGSSDLVPLDLDEYTMTYEDYMSAEKEVQE